MPEDKLQKMIEFAWEELFEVPSGRSPVLSHTGRVVRKNGRPLLFLPHRPGPAALTASLYPAQTAKARVARGILRVFLRAGLPTRLPSGTLRLDSQDPFLAFLARCTGTASAPQFGILAGNPATPGTRFILVVFEPGNQPALVVKAGVTPEAHRLIEREEDFLQSAGGKFTGVPVVRASFQNTRVRAFAMDFVAGRSPSPDDVGGLASLLTNWTEPGKDLVLADIPVWQRLMNAAADQQTCSMLATKCGNRPVHPVVFHGDLAPWNIKASRSGTWTVLDWERGELEGVPCWDWFHYVLQPAILVERITAERLLARTESLLGSEPFARYCGRTGVSGCERDLLLGYLLHCVEVIKPSEGLSTTRELFRAVLAARRRG